MQVGADFRQMSNRGRPVRAVVDCDQMIKHIQVSEQFRVARANRNYPHLHSPSISAINIPMDFPSFFIPHVLYGFLVIGKSIF
ncbi:hypothetical protein B4119_3310 [Parageobacillus caldoxylosilyticus]|uniref:Uncharacterized protein n=1 Tax=Saccharococcus caldoxylosilyticus TaxID=81408 RepID=A0A150LIQ0_9BACL|nr:hypothetical protein B4119_3310 [Parageobacillus caldoxylosilyticus]